ncbi:transmembrane protein, putative [Medicago truncatula]|uniref:Transmembrane protein, putative n=1 Tax=Medicago truncatula TaxID=3880 RepID=A0A072VHC5_MEDTR|nr:transmembrane protein, putative [Medicago truncatula]
MSLGQWLSIQNNDDVTDLQLCLEGVIFVSMIIVILGMFVSHYFLSLWLGLEITEIEEKVEKVGCWCLKKG